MGLHWTHLQAKGFWVDAERRASFRESNPADATTTGPTNFKKTVTIFDAIQRPYGTYKKQ